MPELRQGWAIPVAERRLIAAALVTHSQRQVADMFGVHHGTVRNIGREFGVSPRPRGALKIWPGVRYVWATAKSGWPFHPRNPAPLRWAA